MPARLERGPLGERPRLRLLADGPGIPTRMTDGSDAIYTPWGAGTQHRVDSAITATRRAVFPLLDLDPEAA